MRVVTAAGQTRSLSLADGTRIALNGDTILIFDRSTPRSFRLERGEASFVVVHYPQAPFTVRVDKAVLSDISWRVITLEWARFSGASRGADIFGRLFRDPSFYKQISVLEMRLEILAGLHDGADDRGAFDHREILSKLLVKLGKRHNQDAPGFIARAPPGINCRYWLTQWEAPPLYGAPHFRSLWSVGWKSNPAFATQKWLRAPPESPFRAELAGIGKCAGPELQPSERWIDYDRMDHDLACSLYCMIEGPVGYRSPEEYLDIYIQVYGSY